MHNHCKLNTNGRINGKYKHPIMILHPDFVQEAAWSRNEIIDATISVGRIKLFTGIKASNFTSIWERVDLGSE